MATQRTSSFTEMLIRLDRRSTSPLHRQLEQQVREAVRVGRYEADMAMPSSRALAAQLGITRGVVVEAYEQLAAEGYLRTTPGGTTRVAAGIACCARSTAVPEPLPYRFDFRPGRPDLTEFPRQAWLRSVRRVLETAPAERLGYLEGHGVPELRNALSAYLDRVRGTSTDPLDMVITSGFVQALQLVARVVSRGGTRRVAVEDPWHEDYRRVLRASGMEVVPVPVDDEGMQVDQLATSGVGLVILTPAHQYPRGAVLSAPRRTQLLEWASQAGALVVEDDYDAEFRYDRQPVGALQGLASDHVIYAGTASKTLAPGLRLGWLAVPPRYSEPLARAKTAADYGSGAIDQLTLADFIERGELDRHLRHLRARYGARREALLDGLGRRLPDVEVTGASAGLHVMVRLPAGTDEVALVRAAGERGIGLSGAAETYAGAPTAAGIVFGYGAILEGHIEPGLEGLGQVLQEVRSGR